jgi:exodeoxyribonuclease VII large subunit
VARDFLRVLTRRFAGVHVLIHPVRVQGETAAAEIVEALHELNRRGGFDVVVLARGGGSLEDLWAFNEEAVARAIAASKIPVISAVGHETDFTIADFVADLRAPTPSAAAERVVQAKADLASRIASLERHLHDGMRLRLTRVRARVTAVTSHRVFAAEQGRLRTYSQRIDDLVRRSETATSHRLLRSSDGLRRLRERLEAFRLDRQLLARRERLAASAERLRALFTRRLEARRAALSGLIGKLDTLSPLAVLSRGYALVWDASGRHLLRRAGDASVGDAVRIRLHEGLLRAAITGKEPGP